MSMNRVVRIVERLNIKSVVSSKTKRLKKQRTNGARLQRRLLMRKSFATLISKAPPTEEQATNQILIGHTWLCIRRSI